MRRVRTRVHRGPVITSLHGGHIWMYRLYWHCNSVALVRAHCVYAGFGSPSAAGGSAPSSKKPRQEGSATAPLERSRQRGAQSWPTLANLSSGEGTGGCIPPTSDFSLRSQCTCVHVDKGREGTATAGKKAGWCSVLTCILMQQYLEVTPLDKGSFYTAYCICSGGWLRYRLRGTRKSSGL